MEKDKEERFAHEDISRYFRFGVFIILMLLLLVATFQFYFFAMSAISTLFKYEYRSLVQAGFAACVIAIVVYLLRVALIKER
ncbi:MAG: hypothetical protein J7I99_04145 [Methanophagales archaeon]|nr:hypothetical protein [Methanophagales archaeon]